MINRTALTWGCHAGMFVFGISLAILGALLPSLFQTVRLDPSQAGSLFLFLNLGALLISVSSGPGFDRFGFKTILIISSLFAGVSLLLMARAETYLQLALTSFLLGLGGGGLNAGTNVLIADLYPERRAAALNVLGIFFGFGAFFIPLFIGTLLEVLSLPGILTITGAIALAPAGLLLFLTFPAAKHAAGLPLGQVRTLLRNPVVILFGILLFFQSGNEITSSGWITTYLVQTLGISPANASLYLAGFWGAVMVGRWFSSWILRHVQDTGLVQIGAISASTSMLLFVAFPDPVLSAILICWIGFSMAAIFPSVLGQAASRFPEFSGTVFGILISIALVGGMTVPWLTGYVAEQFTLGTGLLLAAIGFFMVFALQRRVAKT